MLGILYIILGLLLVTSLIINIKRNVINSSVLIEAGLVMYYILPALRQIFADGGNFVSRIEFFHNINIEATFLGYLCVITFYFSFKFARIIKPDNGIIQKYIPNETEKMLNLSILITIFSAVLFILYASLFGGVVEVFRNISDIRGGVIETQTGKYDFINKLYRVAPFALYITIGYLVTIKSPRVIMIVIINFTVAILIAISTGGRGILLQTFIILILGHVLMKRKSIVIKLSHFLNLAIGFVFFVLLYRPLTNASQFISTHGISYAWQEFIFELSNSSKYNIRSIGDTFNSILHSFDHYQASMETALRAVNDGTHTPNFILEIFYSIISIFPSILLGISKPSTITHYNSMYISGFPEVAQIPPGIIGAAYYSGGILWVVLYGFLAGIIGKKIDRFYLSIKNHAKFANTYYVAILFFYFGFAIGGDFATAFQKGLTTIVFIYIINRKLRPVKINNELRAGGN